MAEFRVEYLFQWNGGNAWTGRGETFRLPTENPSTQDFITLLKGQHSNYTAVRIASVEKRGCPKIAFHVSFNYKTRETDSGRVGTSVTVYWYDDSPSMSDLEALVLGNRINDCSVSITEVRKR